MNHNCKKLLCSTQLLPVSPPLGISKEIQRLARALSTIIGMGSLLKTWLPSPVLMLIHILSDYPRLQNSIFRHIEELETSELDESKQSEEVSYIKEKTGLRFVSVQIEESSRRREMDVIAYFCNVDDETDIKEVTVVSLSSEIVKLQSIAYDFIEKEVKHNLRSHGIAVDMHEDILKKVESKLEHHNVKIDYY